MSLSGIFSVTYGRRIQQNICSNLCFGQFRDNQLSYSGHAIVIYKKISFNTMILISPIITVGVNQSQSQIKFFHQTFTNWTSSPHGAWKSHNST